MTRDIARGEAQASVIKRDILIEEIYSFNLAAAFNFGTGMSITIYHILSNKHILQRLQSELREAFPDTEGDMTSSAIGRLPYLVSCEQ